MNGNLGRDKVWNEQIWNDIDKAVREEMGRIRVAQKVFPSVLFPNNAQPIPVGKVEIGSTILLEEEEAKPFFEIAAGFALSKSQVESEENLHSGKTLARVAASRLARAEDLLLFTGKQVPPAEGVTVTKMAFVNHLTQPAAAPRPAKQAVSADGIFKRILAGMGELSAAYQSGPYALVLASAAYAETFAPLGNIGTAADRIAALITGGFYSSAVLDDSTGILVSLGGEPATIFIGVDATTAFTQMDVSGRYCFRVFERIQFVVRSEAAFRHLTF